MAFGLRSSGVWLACCLMHAVCAPACTSEPAQSVAPPPPPPPPPPAAPPPQVRTLPAGSNPAAGIPDPLAALQALSALGGQPNLAPAGPIVHWRELARFLPERLAGFDATGELEGSTTSVGGLQVTTIDRAYARGADRARIEIVDTSFAPFMRAPFAMVQLVQQDSSNGYKRSARIKGHPAIAEWSKQHAKGAVHLLAAERFLINVDVESASEGLAESVANALDVAGIVAAGSRPAKAAAAPNPPQPTGP